MELVCYVLFINDDTSPDSNVRWANAGPTLAQPTFLSGSRALIPSLCQIWNVLSCTRINKSTFNSSRCVALGFWLNIFQLYHLSCACHAIIPMPCRNAISNNNHNTGQLGGSGICSHCFKPYVTPIILRPAMRSFYLLFGCRIWRRYFSSNDHVTAGCVVSIHFQ